MSFCINSSLHSWIRLRPRPNEFYISRNHSVLITRTEGFIDGGHSRGFFTDETRLVSVYKWRINGTLPEFVAVSALEQHSSLAYYIAPGSPDDKAAQQAIELRIARSIDSGLHEDIDMTSYSQPV